LRQGEDVFNAPSVFNFFPPDFPLPGEDGLVGPEFGILSTTTVLARANLYYQLIYQSMPTDQYYRPDGTRLDTSMLLPLADDPAQLVESLNQQLLHGTMSEPMREIVMNEVSSGTETAEDRVREAVYLVATSAAYQVQR
jgi:hypothetical protein